MLVRLAHQGHGERKGRKEVAVYRVLLEIQELLDSQDHADRRENEEMPDQQYVKFFLSSPAISTIHQLAQGLKCRTKQPVVKLQCCLRL